MRKVIASLLLAWFFTVNAVLAMNGAWSYQAIPSASTNYVLHGQFNVLQIWSDPSAADLYITLDGSTATVAGANTIHIPGGAGWQSPVPANSGFNISNFSAIGSTSTGKFTFVAF